MTEIGQPVLIELSCLEDTEILGEALGRVLKAGDVLALVGDLGSGKTTFTQAIARGLGITDEVTSPTFSLVHEYRGRTPMFHFDPYRLTSSEDVFNLGFQEYFERPGVVVCEWADRIESLLPDDLLLLRLEIVEVDGAAATPAMQGAGERRRVKVVAYGVRSQDIVSHLLESPELSALGKTT